MLPSIMVRNSRLTVVLLAGILVVVLTLSRVGNYEEDSFVGLCVYSTGGFSVLTNGTASVGVSATLKPGEVYLVRGRLYRSRSGLRMDPSFIGTSHPTFPLNELRGAYWPSRGFYLLTPRKVRLGLPLNVSKGTYVLVRGLFYGGRFYPVTYTRTGPPTEPEDGMPWWVGGVVIYSGRRTVIWNGSEELALYLPYGTRLRVGTRVRALGIFRRYSMPTILVDSEDDVTVIGMAPREEVGRAGIGEIAVGRCTVIGRGKSYLRLNCTGLRLYGFNARDGDVVRFEALVRKSSMLCLNCTLERGREELPSGVCNFSPGKFVRITGTVSWVRVYGNGFGLANVTDGDCWVLLKLRKSLGVSLRTNETLTAYGTFTTYRGMPALEIGSGEDVCSGNC